MLQRLIVPLLTSKLYKSFNSVRQIKIRPTVHSASLNCVSTCLKVAPCVNSLKSSLQFTVPFKRFHLIRCILEAPNR